MDCILRFFCSDEKENVSSDDDTPILEKLKMLNEKQSKREFKLSKLQRPEQKV